MKNFDFAIIAEYNRTKTLNEFEELTETQIEAITDYCNSVWAMVKIEELEEIEDTNKYIENVLNNNGLEFSDKRCYIYLEDALDTMLREIF